MSWYLEIFMADYQRILGKEYKYLNNLLEVREYNCKSQQKNMSLLQTSAAMLLLAQHKYRSNKFPKPMSNFQHQHDREENPQLLPPPIVKSFL